MSRILSPLKTYNLKAGNLLTIGGIIVGGYGKDGGVTYSYGSSRYEDVVGADGQTTVSRLNDERMYVEITLMENSPAYKELLGLMRVQEIQATLPTGILPLPFLHEDIINGDTIASGYCVFMDQPEPSKSRTVGEVTFKLLLPNAAGTVVLSALNFG